MDGPPVTGPVDTVSAVPDVIHAHPEEWGERTLRRVERLVSGLGIQLGAQAGILLDRHGYRVGADGSGPHRNVLGHPLFELPVWLAQGSALSDDALMDICEASLCGYLSVRCDDDYFDGAWDDAGGAMILSGVFRARHHALLAPLTSHRGFWERFEQVWRGYGEAMLLERSLHHPGSDYGRAQFGLVLGRSQPLEVPGEVVLAMIGRWEEAAGLREMVSHLNTATQLFDDFVDAPDDLEQENFTWMVRRLGGFDGMSSLRQGMIAGWDEVVGEIDQELGEALRIGESLGLDDLRQWVSARRHLLDQASQRMFRVLFGTGGSDEPAGVA